MSPASFPGSVKNFGADRVDGDYIPAADMNDIRAEVVALETAALAGGWISDPNTWTFATASTFTIAGDKTGIYTKGLKLRWTQTTVKYGVVLSASYAGGVTTVTIIVNSDYTITNAAISANGYSRASDPLGWPGWFAYVPTFTGFVATPNYSATYNVSGGICFMRCNNWGGTSNATTFTITAPVNAAADTLGASVRVVNNSIGEACGEVSIAVGGNIVTLTRSVNAAWTNANGKAADFVLVYPW